MGKQSHREEKGILLDLEERKKMSYFAFVCCDKDFDQSNLGRNGLLWCTRLGSQATTERSQDKTSGWEPGGASWVARSPERVQLSGLLLPLS